ncbi:hypothetical protein COT50_00160 [candidate division WWE3 bacterium CG08_land_8_20_14_0_20_41_10]|uniref:Uncharacterized protein n=1 Tax=candidate division WWE3 bacterium CG08_land_8_20_14_0_20_41_10 TaxID=1975085 RepID=A0A2H0XF83_UNCKA|nr:MAG: hypothetical protein COT50_00160 [candidate division WWE3 bacterium CG08_land_8_20_14_0_20_41_10]
MTNINKQILDNLRAYFVDDSLLPIKDSMLEIGRVTDFKLVYGETYDTFGLTIDSLKYYFFLSVLNSLLAETGTKTAGTVIVGDVASVRNKSVDEEGVKKQISKNTEMQSKICATYRTALKFERMSDLFETSTFKEALANVRRVFSESHEMADLAEKTVLKNKLKQESEAEFQYSLEEVALITGYDIKVGPKREINYDRMANIVRKSLKRLPLQGFYLKPTYPLGLQFDYLLKHPEVEKYGLTPYKAGSNKLQNFRVVLGKTSLNQIEELIKSSFCPADITLPNAVRELYLTGLLAKALITKDLGLLANESNFNLPSGNDVIRLVQKYIFEPLEL